MKLDLDAIAARGRSEAGFSGTETARAINDASNHRYPLAGIGTGNVVVVRQRGEYFALLGRRGKGSHGDLAHSGSWGLVGGYVDLDKSESVNQASAREISEETLGVLALHNADPIELGQYIDYGDKHNGQTISIGKMYMLTPEQTQTLHAAMANGSMMQDKDGNPNMEVSEFKLVSLNHLQEEINSLNANGGIGYEQDMVHLYRAREQLVKRQLIRDTGNEHAVY